MIIQLYRGRQNQDKSRLFVQERESPRVEARLYVRNPEGRYEQHLGNLGLGGCFFKTSDFMVLGQEVALVLVLEELDLKVKVSGKVIRLMPDRRYMGVAVKFDELSFETERMLARWLDLRTQAEDHGSYAA